MTEIMASAAGEYQTATGMYASYGGEWVEVPLGGTPEWKRPADWLPTTVTAAEQKIQVLAHVGADSSIETNRQMTVMAQPAYTVDWGDGSAVESIGSGVVATHLYNPSSLAGTATSTGLLQALVTVTPQAGTFSAFAISSQYSTGKTYRSPAVEIAASAPGANFFNFGVQACTALTRVEFKVPTVIFSTTNLFSGCTSLREIVGEIRNNASGAALSGMFQNCTVLVKFPTLTFNGQHDTAASTFNGCAAMTEVPPFLSGYVTTWTSAFLGCTSLEEVPASLNTSAGTTFTSMFSGCSRLVTVPTLNTASGTTFTSMFSGCTSLTTLPALTTGLATNMASMFLNCASLETVSLSSTTAVTTFATMFSGCTNLATLTGLDLSGPTAASGFTNMFLGCSRLSKIGVLSGKGPRFTHTVAPTLLDAAALNDFYTQLPTVTGQTITVTGVPGTLADNPTIATAKGWTVTGS